MNDFFAVIAVIALISAAFGVIGLVVSVIAKQEQKVRIFTKVTWISAAVFFVGMFLSSVSFSGDAVPPTDTSKNTVVSSASHDTSEKQEKTDVSPVSQSGQVKAATIYTGHNTIVKTKESEADSVTFYFENNSKNNLSFCVYAYSVNGIMMAYCNEYDTYTEVAAGKKASGTLDIPSEWLDINGIDEIKQIKVHFWAYGESMKEFETGIIELPIDGGESVDYTPGNALYNKDGIFIWALDDDNYDAIFAIRNDRKKYFDFDLENVSVNDWTQEANLIEYKTEVFPGCVAAYGIDFDQDKLAKDGIEQIKKVDFGLDIRPEGDYFSNFHTDPITIDKQ